MTSDARVALRAALMTLGGVIMAGARPASCATPGRPTIVLVSIDTLRADHLKTFGYDQETSPFLDSLARGGLVFTNATVPLPNTTPSHGSMLTGLYPARHGSTGLAIPLSPSVDTLAAALRRAGYDTAGVVAVNHLGAAFHFDKGFQQFTQPQGLQRDGRAVNRDALRFARDHAQRRAGTPLFLFVHYFDCHAPYGWWKDPPPPDMASLPVAERIRRYDQSIRHTDDLVAELYEGLRAAGLTEDLLLCITADHGEQIGDRGLPVGHADIYRETVHVPLIFFGTGIAAGRIDDVVSTLDIAPSLLAAVGARPAAPVDGQDILTHRRRWFDRILASVGWTAEKPHDLVVSGNPGYTRSLMIIRGSYWYIRNLDHLYEAFAVASEDDTTAREGLRALAPAADATDGVAYALPAAALPASTVTVRFSPSRASGCAEMTAGLAPNVRYFSTPVRPVLDTVVQFTVARFDRVSLRFQPATCAGRLSYRMDDPARAPRLAAPTSGTTQLFELLYAERKRRQEDELYDVAADPAMLRNLITDASKAMTAQDLNTRLGTLFSSLASPETNASSQVSAEEIERLKGLGYTF